MKMRVAASVLLAGSVMLGLSACEFVTPQQTARSYSPSDGVNASAGVVDVRDAFLVTTNGTDASMIVSLINTSSSPETLSMQYHADSGSVTKKVDLPANGLVSSRPGSAVDVTFRDIKTEAGALFPVYFTAGGKGVEVTVPVLNTTLPGYQTLAPSPVPDPTDTSQTPTPTPTPTDG